MKLTDLILIRIKEEITNDPYKIGYAGKTDDEILNMLNQDVTVEVITLQKMPAPINRILQGIQSAPNIVSLTDISEASKVVLSDSEVIKDV